MMSFWRVLSSERLKMSKSYVWLLVIGSPVLSLVPGLLSDNQGEKMSWELLLSVMSMMHALLFLPVLSGIFAALICRYEHHDGGWKLLLSLPVTRLSVYLSKYVMIIGLLAAVQVTFLVMVLGMGLFRGAPDPIPWELLLKSVFGGFVACLPLAALQLAISQSWSSFGAPLALNVSLTIPNILIANSSTYGPYYPWVQPLLAMSPYGDDGFGAFNLPLETLIMIVGGSLIVFFAAGLISFYRKAV
ncbi:ABC transporter permease [Paenibacillus sp. FSL H3-0286]|uniref:ABC transporter permease n=1 Tax=Paenibacillus sp. FSL H3-0286 TaxID=2921427 RepID=UPI0032525D6E